MGRVKERVGHDYLQRWSQVILALLRRMSQHELTRQIGAGSHSTVYYWKNAERLKGRPDSVYLTRVAGVLGWSRSQLDQYLEYGARPLGMGGEDFKKYLLQGAPPLEFFAGDRDSSRLKPVEVAALVEIGQRGAIESALRVMMYARYGEKLVPDSIDTEIKGAMTASAPNLAELIARALALNSADENDICTKLNPVYWDGEPPMTFARFRQLAAGNPPTLGHHLPANDAEVAALQQLCDPHYKLSTPPDWQDAWARSVAQCQASGDRNGGATTSGVSS